MQLLNPNVGRKVTQDIYTKESISTIDDVLNYAKNKFNLKFDSQIISMWKNDLVSGELKIPEILIMVDSIGNRKLKK